MELADALGLGTGSRPMIAFVGGGGKTSGMFRLAGELKARGMNVLVTTTTHIYYPEKVFFDRFYPYADIAGDSASLAARGQPSVSVVGKGISGDMKLLGISGEEADILFEKGVSNAVLVEADGSRGRPLKAPAAHEPVIPGRTSTVVGVVGMDCIGREIGPEWVHRPEILASLTGRTPGDIIDEETVARLVLSEAGLFKNCPLKAQKVLLLNKAEGSGLAETAARIGAAVLAGHIGDNTHRSRSEAFALIDRVLIGSMTREDPVLRILRT